MNQSYRLIVSTLHLLLGEAIKFTISSGLGEPSLQVTDAMESVCVCVRLGWMVEFWADPELITA